MKKTIATATLLALSLLVAHCAPVPTHQWWLAAIAQLITGLLVLLILLGVIGLIIHAWWTMRERDR